MQQVFSSGGGAQGNRCEEANAEPEGDAAQFLIVLPQHLHLNGVRALQQNKTSMCEYRSEAMDEQLSFPQGMQDAQQ